MKPLSELKISPTPWIAKDILGHRVFNGEGFELCDSDSAFSAADARFIEASPKLYDRAQKLVSAFDKREMTAEHIEALRSALAEAAGEEENK